jgi:DNA-binding HxlR family transcriptional regulator
MRRTSFEDMHCSVAQTLELVGEWWTLLVVRDLLLGVTRFEALQEGLGISRNILTDRLRTLEEAGIVERHAYQDRPARYDYRLTEKGRDLWTVVNAVREWGDRWAAPEGPPLEMVHRRCGHTTSAVLTCSHCREPLEYHELRMRAGPGGGELPERRL